MHKLFIKTFENSSIRLSDQLASKLASSTWVICIALILLIVLAMSGSSFELLWVVYGIAGGISILVAAIISSIFGFGDPLIIGGILLFALTGIVAIGVIILLTLLIVSLAKKKLWAWWLLTVAAMAQLLLGGLAILVNPTLNNLLTVSLAILALYLLYSIRRFFK